MSQQCSAMCNTIAALSRVVTNFLRKARPQYHWWQRRRALLPSPRSILQNQGKTAVMPILYLRRRPCSGPDAPMHYTFLSKPWQKQLSFSRTFARLYSVYQQQQRSALCIIPLLLHYTIVKTKNELIVACFFLPLLNTAAHYIGATTIL